MAVHDRFGLALTTTSAAAHPYCAGVDRLLALIPDADERFVHAINADDRFGLAWSARAYLLWASGHTDDAAEAAALAVRLSRTATARERQHARAVAAYIRSDVRAVPLMRAHIVEFPDDALILQLLVYAISYGGNTPQPKQAIHALLQQAGRVYADDWWFSGISAFAHQEVGLVHDARRLAERALQRNSSGAWGAHALTHVFHETGDDDGGTRFVSDWLADGRATSLRGHMAWHHALFRLDQGDLDGAERLLVEEIVSPESRSPTSLEDVSSLLWRRWIHGTSRDALPWDLAVELAGPTLRRGGTWFRQVFAALALAGGNRRAALAKVCANLANRPEAVVTETVLPLVLGIAAFGDGAYAEAAEQLGRAMPSLPRIGGSQTQRDVFEDTLIVACMRAGDAGSAATLLRARLERRPSRRDEAWLVACDGADSHPLAHAPRGQARDVLPR